MKKVLVQYGNPPTTREVCVAWDFGDGRLRVVSNGRAYTVKRLPERYEEIVESEVSRQKEPQ